MAVRSGVLNFGADSFTATSLFVLTTVITFSLFLAVLSLTQDLLSLAFQKAKTGEVEKMSEKHSDRVIPIEVKAEENDRSRSMSTYISANPEGGLKGSVSP